MHTKCSDTAFEPPGQLMNMVTGHQMLIMLKARPLDASRVDLDENKNFSQTRKIFSKSCLSACAV